MKIFAVAYGAAHVNMVMPVLRELESRGHESVVMGLTTAAKVFRENGFKTVGFCDFVGEDERVQEWGAKLLEGCVQHPNVSREESVAYLGGSYVDLIDRVGEEKAAEEYAAKGRRAFLPMGVLRKAFERIQPDLVVTTSSPRGERAAVSVGRELGVPTVVMVGIFPTQEMGWLGEAGYGNRVCVMTEAVRQQHIEHGRLPEEMVVTGNPAFDKLASDEAREIGVRWRKGRGIAEGKKLAVFASQTDLQDGFGMGIARDVSAQFDADGEWILMVRPHPNEDFDLSILPDHVLVSGRDEPLQEVLFGCDALLVVSSTVGVEAKMAGKKVVKLPYVPGDPDPHYEKMGIAVACDDVGDLMSVLEDGSVMDEGAMGGATLGRAAQNVADVAERLVLGT